MNNRIGAAIFVATALSTGVVYAQQAPAAGSGSAQAAGAASENQEVIVTAQKRSERLSDVPLSITAATGVQLTKQGINSPGDLERITPGFTYRLGQNGTPVFAIRGIGFYSEQAAVAPTVTIYTDQVPLPYARMSEGAAFDIDRVEVLKGPQGTLFGQNATGGAVNYIAAKPTATPKSGFDLTYGSFNAVGVDAFVSGPLTDTLKARAAVHYEGAEGWQQNSVRSGTLGVRDFLAGRLLLDWKPTDRFSAELNVNAWRDLSDVQAGQARGYLPVSSTPPFTPQTLATYNALSTYPYQTGNNNRLADWDAGKSYRRNDRFYQIAGHVNYDFSDHLHLISITSYANLGIYAPIDSDSTDVPALVVDQYGAIRTFNQELRLEGDVDRLKWVVGADYEHDDTNEVQYTFIQGSNSQIPSFPGPVWHSFGSDNLFNKQTVSSAAAFASLDFRLTDTLTIQGGARYTNEDRDFVGCLADTPAPDGFGKVAGLVSAGPDLCVTGLPSGVPGQYHTTLNQDNVSWRGSLNWKPGRNMLFYASATKGYKSGDFGTLPALTYLQFQPVQQESVLAYEVGAKVRLLDNKLDLSAAAFYDDYRNKQTQGSLVVPPFGNLPYLVNVPKSEIYGFEWEAAFRPIHNLKLSFGGNYLQSKILGQALVASPYGDLIDADGEELPITPKWQIQADAEYDFDITDTLTGFVGGSVSSRTSTYAQLGAKTGPAGTQNQFLIDGYTLLDLRAGVDINKNLSVEMFGKNVTNQGYWSNVVHIYDTYARITGQPATWGVRLSGRF